MQEETVKVKTFLALMSPLVPSGKLAVLITGVPLRSSHRDFRAVVIREAARVKAHRARGVSTLQVHFGPGRSECDGASLLICVDIGADTKRKRAYRLALLLVGCVLLLAVMRACVCRSAIVLK